MKRKKYIISIGIILIILGIIIYTYNNYNYKKTTQLEKKEIKLFFDSFNNYDNNIKSNYLAILEIPKINLIKGLYNLNTSNNDVLYNIEILQSSDMPDVINGNFILASHSGNGNNAYFTNLDKLTIGDISYIYYNNNKYEYIVKDIYKVEKNGTVEIRRNKNTTNLTMITCDELDKSKQIVVISEKKDK